MKGKKLRFIFSFIVTFCLVLAFAPITYAINEVFSINGIYYQITSEDEKTVKMVAPPQEASPYNGEIVIPEKITYSDSDYTVTSIGEEAFGESEEVTNIVIPSTVTSIGINAFGGCTALTSLVIPASVTDGLGGAMTGLLGRDFTISFKHPDWMNIDVTFGKGSPYSIEGGVLYNGTVAEAALDYDATTITIREGTTEIADVAFNFPFAPGTYYYNKIDRRKTETVVLPPSVKIIGEMAFKYCPLKNINLSSTETIEAGAFVGTYITEADLTQVKMIGYQAFSGCTDLSNVIWPTNLEKFELGDPNGVGSDPTASMAFEKCTSLKSVVLKGTLTNIPKGTFQNCKNIELVVVSDSVTEIGEAAFQNAFSSNGATIIMQNSIPPAFDQNAFNTDADLVVIVPTGSESAYATVDTLKDHMTDDNGNIIQNQDYSVKVDKNTAAICLDSQQDHMLVVTSEIPEYATLEVTSNDSTVATVSNKAGSSDTYTIYGVSVGEAAITATVKYGDIILAEDTCIVTISNHIADTGWKSNHDNHWHECSVCGEKADEAKHTFKWIIDKKPTETEKGLKHQECEECGYQKEGVFIPMTGVTVTAKPDDRAPSHTNKIDISKTTDVSKSSIKTGDNSEISLYISTFIISVLFIVIVTVRRRLYRK